jgi:phosphoribosylformimino-5-aminoimidazole carboxamide ribotide isomerase
MLRGTSNELYKNISDRFPEVKLIASGGVSSVKDLDLLQQLKVDGAIIGKAIYENRITLKELQNYVD